MKMYAPYLVAPYSTLPDGSPVHSRKLTVHSTHESAMAECRTRLDERGNPLYRYAIYQAITLVQRAETPVEVCDIVDEGEVICP